MHRCRPAVSEGSSNILDRYNIAPSTAASTSSPSPRLSTTPQPRRPARPLPEPLTGQIPIDGARPHGGPRVPSWEAFRRRPPRARANSYDGAGIRNPSPQQSLPLPGRVESYAQCPAIWSARAPSKKVMPPGGSFRRRAAPSREFRPRGRDPRPRGRASERRQFQQGW